jgi:hypothetical protein
MKICFQAFIHDDSALDITTAVASVDEDMLRPTLGCRAR